MDVVIRVENADTELVTALLETDGVDAELFDAVGVDGGGELATIIVSVAGPTLTALVATLRAWWGRAQHVKIEVDGVKVEGASPDQIEAILKRMLADRGKTPPLPTSDEPKA